jgi:alkylation response protein AidB-like acyl-CoA dehydrogenase
MRSTVKSKGGFYQEMADTLQSLPEDCGGPLLAEGIRTLNRIIMGTRRQKLTRSQYVMFLLADMMTWCEIGDALCHKAASHRGDQKRSVDFMKATARLLAREAIEKVYLNGVRIVHGCGQEPDTMAEDLGALNLGKVMRDHLRDMDLISAELVRE